MCPFLSVRLHVVAALTDNHYRYEQWSDANLTLALSHVAY